MRAIVLSGGGAKGAYQIGVWKALRKLNIHYDIVTGTSVGALNGAFMVQRDYLHALWMWYHINFDMITAEKIDVNYKTFSGLKKIIKLYAKGVLDGGIDVTKLEQTMQQYINLNKFYHSPIKYGLVTVNLTTLKPVELKKEDIPKDKLKDYLMASATCFPAFKKKKIGDQGFVDGGYYDNLPIHLAIELGATEVIAVDLKAIGVKKKVKEDIPITYIRPRTDIGSFLIFDKELSRRAIRLGYLDTLKTFHKLEGNIFTFRNGELDKNKRKYKDIMIRRMKEIFHLDTGGTMKELFMVSKYRAFFQDTKRVGNEMNEILEYLGRAFELSDTRIYTLSSFQREIKKRMKYLEPFEFSQLEEKWKNKNLKNIRYSKTILQYLVQKIEQQDNKNHTEFMMLAMLFPKDMLAAIYMTLLS